MGFSKCNRSCFGDFWHLGLAVFQLELMKFVALEMGLVLGSSQTSTVIGHRFQG